jgi:hypothetical protein
MTLTNFVRFLKIVYSGLAPQMFYYIGFICLWLLSFQAVVFVRHIAIFFYQFSTLPLEDLNFLGIGVDSDSFQIAGNYYRDSVYNPAHHFYKIYQSHLRFNVWSLYVSQDIHTYNDPLKNLSFQETVAERKRILNLKTKIQKRDHSYFFLTTELFGKIKQTQHYKWMYYGSKGGQYAYYDNFEDIIVNPTLSNASHRYSVEFLRYNLAFYFNDPIMVRQIRFPDVDNDENCIADTLAYSFVGFFFINAMRNDFWMISSDYFLFRHHDDLITQQDDEDINTAYHVFMNVPRCLDFVKNDGIVYKLFEQIHDDFMKGASEERIFFLMEHFGESNFLYDDIYIDSIEEDELGGSLDFASNIDLDIPEGQDYDDTIWELRWDPAIDYALSNIIKGTILYKYTKFVHIDHMKNYLGGMV